MAFDFSFQFGVCIVHPTIDSMEIARRCHILVPVVDFAEVHKDTSKDDRPVSSEVQSLMTHVFSDFQGGARLSTEHVEFSGLFFERLTDLAEYHEFLDSVRNGGRISLVVLWYSHTPHSAVGIAYDSVDVCAELGMDLELHFFGPSPTAVTECTFPASGPL